MDVVSASVTEVLKLQFFQYPAGGQLHWFQREVRLYVGKKRVSHLIYSISKQCPDMFMVSISSFKSSSIQGDFHFVNYGPIQSQIDDKPWQA